MRYNLPSLRRARHPLTRLISGLLGIAAAAVMLVFGVVAIAVLLAGGVLFVVWRYWNRRPAAASVQAGTSTRAPKIIDGEFVVIRQGRPVSH
ncbi:hypothetical protein ACYJW8_11610 [Frateuria aurantia]